MKKHNILKVALGTLMCTALLSGTCLAAEREGEMEGLAVSIDTDKEEYEAGDHITVKVSVKNTTEETAEDVIIKNVIPEGYQVVSGSETDFVIDSIDAGTEVIKTTEYEVKSVAVENTDDDDDDDDHHHHDSKSKTTSATPTTEVEDTLVPLADTVETVVIPEEAVSQTDAPKTGDDSNMAAWMALLVVSAGACAVLYVKRKELRKYLALALVLTVAGGSISFGQASVHAAEAHSLHLAKDVSVAGNTLTVETNVYYGAIVAGTVYDAANPDTKIAGATIKFRAGSNNQSGEYVKDASGAEITVTTGDNGNYEYALPVGDYTAECSKEGYITSYKNVSSSVTAGNYDIAMSEVLNGDEYRVVLTWGEYPSDLDSHLKFEENGNDYHVYFSKKKAVINGNTVAELDVDDTTSYGPETVTFTMKAGINYHYYVYNYSGGDDKLAASGAKITVFKGDSQIAQYEVPENTLGRYWNVFELKDGEIHSIDKVGNNENVTENNTADTDVAVAALLLEEETLTEELTTEEAIEETTETDSAEEESTEEVTESDSEELDSEEETSEEESSEAESEETAEAEATAEESESAE